MGHLKFGERKTETLTMKYKALMERVLVSGENDAWFVKYDSRKLARQREVAIETVRRAGVPIDPDSEFEIQYDGNTIMAGRMSGWSGNTHELQHPSNIIHDLAHWAVCASLKRRRMPDFGLGRGPDSSPDDRIPEALMDARKTQKEEERASLLGIMIELELGFPAADTLRLHQWFFHFDPIHSRGTVYTAPDGEWYTESAKGITAACNWLFDKKLLVGEGEVNWDQVSVGVAR